MTEVFQAESGRVTHRAYAAGLASGAAPLAVAAVRRSTSIGGRVSPGRTTPRRTRVAGEHDGHDEGQGGSHEEHPHDDLEWAAAHVVARGRLQQPGRSERDDHEDRGDHADAVAGIGVGPEQVEVGRRAAYLGHPHEAGPPRSPPLPRQLRR